MGKRPGHGLPDILITLGNMECQKQST